MINSNNMYQEHDLKCQRHDLNKPRRMTLHINYVRPAMILITFSNFFTTSMEGLREYFYSFIERLAPTLSLINH